MLEKPLDLPFYKGIQLPTHLKWVSIFSKQNETVLMQEIHALDQEIKRLKEIKAMHKEFRRYVEMPSKISLLINYCSWCYVKTMSLLQVVGEKEASLHP